MWTTRLSWIVLLAVGCAGKHPGGNDDTAWWLLPDLGDGDDDDGDDDDDDDSICAGRHQLACERKCQLIDFVNDKMRCTPLSLDA